MRCCLVALACVASGAASHAQAQATPDSVSRRQKVKTEYDALTDSTTRSFAAYAMVDTSLTPPDTFAVELTQRWKGQGTVAPVAWVELGLGRTRPEGLPPSRSLRGTAGNRPAVVFLLDGGRRIRLERTEYVSNAGAPITFETARYRISSDDLRRIAECLTLRVLVGERELTIDAAWRRVAAAVVAGQAPPPGLPVRKSP